MAPTSTRRAGATLAATAAMLLGVACTALAAHAPPDVKDLASVREAVVAQKREDVLVILAYDANDYPAVVNFIEAVGSFAGGAAFATTSNRDVFERYDISPETGLPAVLALVNFDEEGNTKRGKKRRIDMEIDREREVGDGESVLDKLEVRRFIVTAILPPVLPLPEMNRMGPDASERASIAISTHLPKLFVVVRDDADDALNDAMAHVAEQHRGHLIVMRLKRESGDEQGNMLMESIGIFDEDLGKAKGSTAIVLVDAANPEESRRFTKFDGHPAKERLSDFVGRALDGRLVEDVYPLPSGASSVRHLDDDSPDGGAKKGKKKGKKQGKTKGKKTKKGKAKKNKNKKTTSSDKNRKKAKRDAGEL